MLKQKPAGTRAASPCSLSGGRRASLLFTERMSPVLWHRTTRCDSARDAGPAASLVGLVLEYVQVIGGSHGNDVLRWVPGRVQNLLAEVQAVHAHLVLLSLPTCTHSARLQAGARLAVLPGSFQRNIPPCSPIEHSEEVVVGPSHDCTAQNKERKTSKWPPPTPSPARPWTRG